MLLKSNALSIIFLNHNFFVNVRVNTVKEAITDYILNLSNESSIEGSINLFENGYLSSLDVLDIICFIEENYKISVTDDDLGMDNFSSIDKMIHYIEKKQQEK